jgi:hypothetical protein
MSSTKNGKPVNWLKTNHGDHVTLIVSTDDQRNGIPGSPTSCAVVQTVARSSPDVYKVEVSEANMKVWVHGPNDRDYRGRLILDKATRELAKKYDEHKLSAPTTITLIVNKWYEVRHYKRARVLSKVKSEMTPNESEADLEAQLNEQGIVRPINGDQTEIIEQELVQKSRRRQRSAKNRWDIDSYIVPASV